ncbi:MAG: hypothetical protein WCE46_09410 [Methanoregula sp.]
MAQSRIPLVAARKEKTGHFALFGIFYRAVDRAVEGAGDHQSIPRA